MIAKDAKSLIEEHMKKNGFQPMILDSVIITPDIKKIHGEKKTVFSISSASISSIMDQDLESICMYVENLSYLQKACAEKKEALNAYLVKHKNDRDKSWYEDQYKQTYGCALPISTKKRRRTK